MTDSLRSVRLWPDDWLHPLSLDQYFGRQAPLEVDVGCGKGRFLLARAAAYPDVNFLGLERMLERIRRVDRRAVRRKLENIRLLRMEAYYAVTHLMPVSAVRTYYIFFPDPWPKKKHHDHRLFNDRFLDALHRTLQPGGVVHTATDHLPYHDVIRETLSRDARFAPVEPFIPSEAERTDFEKWYIERGPIGRCSFRRVD